MIVGVGIDLVETERIRSAIERTGSGELFVQRVFTLGEIAYCERHQRRFERYAARFAAKEALVKALGAACAWHDAEVIHVNDAPQLRLSGRAESRARELGISRLHLSLTHTEHYAAATVIAET